VSLSLTGERTLPGEPYWFARHEAAYRWVADRITPGARVLDAGCGEGYGAHMLCAAGAQVVAVEYDDPACRHARHTYRLPIVRANLASLPFAPGSFDVVVAMQVIEHLWSLSQFLIDVRGLLVPGGELIVTTPNRPVFSPGLDRGEKPVNIFHVEEFDAEQVERMLLTAGFTDVTVLGLHQDATATTFHIGDHADSQDLIGFAR
jgi:2-polyprenyl-3-methyl-5-hydroxy-6-metoxy-1,4-benzoquinol methylase